MCLLCLQQFEEHLLFWFQNAMGVYNKRVSLERWNRGLHHSLHRWRYSKELSLLFLEAWAAWHLMLGGSFFSCLQGVFCTSSFSVGNKGSFLYHLSNDARGCGRACFENVFCFKSCYRTLLLYVVDDLRSASVWSGFLYAVNKLVPMPLSDADDRIRLQDFGF